MAKINFCDMKELNKERNSVHKDVDATYTTFTENGKRYFQIDSYGKSDREFVGKTSQTFQVDKDSAVKLIELLNKCFSL